MLVFHDASFANLKDKGSQGGFLIFLSDQLNKSLSLIAWQSRKLRRVVNSTLSAEALQMIDAAGKAYWIQCLLEEVCKIKIPIQCVTDSKTLYEAVHSTKQVLDNRLRIDIAILKEMITKKEINEISWVPKEQQLADCLTKRGASCKSLIQTLEVGAICTKP